MRYLFAFLCPPIVAFIYGGCGSFILNCILFVLGYIPSVIHAIALIIRFDQHKNQQELLQQLERQRLDAQNQFHPRQRQVEPTIIPAMNGDIIDIEKE